MAMYEHTKTLIRAIPVIDTETEKVKTWEITVEYRAVSNGWANSYSHKEDVSALNKGVAEFTKTELVGFMPSIISDHVFDAHFEANNVPATPISEQVLSDFNADDLDD